MTIIAIRKVDELGRLLIPSEARQKLHIETGKDLAVGISDEGNIMLISN